MVNDFAGEEALWALSNIVQVCVRQRAINGDTNKLQLLKSFFTQKLQDVNIDNTEERSKTFLP